MAPALIEQSFRATDPMCRKNVGQSLVPGCQLGEVSQLMRLPCPVSVLLAIEDRIINTAYVHSLGLERLSNHGVIELSGTGHFPHLEDPLRFNEILGTFLEGVFESSPPKNAISGRRR